MQDDFQKRLGLRVREVRKQKGYSQEGFADACNLHRTHISLLERGKVDVKISTLRKVAGVLEISLSELLRD